MERKGLLKLVIPITLLVALVVALPLMSGCAAKPEKEVIKVGLVIPITGPIAADGAEMSNGAILAVEEINEAGGLLGKRLELYPYDTKLSEPDVIRSAAEALVAKGVDVFITGYQITLADVVTFGKYDMPYLHANTKVASVEAMMEGMPETSNIFQIDAVETVYGDDAFWNMTVNIGYDVPSKTGAVLTDDTSYSSTIAQRFKEVLAENNWELVHDSIHAFGTTEFGVELSEIRAENPAIIFFSTWVAVDAVAFMNQFLMDPTDSLIYIQYSPNIPEFRELLGEKANGVLWQTSIGWLPTPKGLAFVDRYTKRFGVKPGYTCTANTYDGIGIWAQAVEAVGDEKAYDEVCDYILTHPFEGVAGTYIFDPERRDTKQGNVGEGIPNQFFQIQHGEQVLLVLGDQPTGALFELPHWLE